MYNLKFLECANLKASLEEFGKKETSSLVIDEALKILRSICWSTEGVFLSLDDEMFTDPRIKKLFLSIHELKEKETIAQNEGFESIKLLVESHLIHHLWNHIDFTPIRYDEFAPLSALVLSEEQKFKRKRGRRELEEGLEPCLSLELKPRDRDEELIDKWSRFVDSIDGWFKANQTLVNDENKSQNLESEVHDSLSAREETPKKRARLLSPDSEREREAPILYNRREELALLKKNWDRLKMRIETYPHAELFDRQDEKNRKRQYLEFGCRFAAAFSVLNESKEGEFCFSSISEFINLCYQGWDVEIKFLEKSASNQTTFTDPILKAWKINRDVRRGLVSEAVLKVFGRNPSSDGQNQSVNRHYQSAMELALNQPFCLGYSGEELSRFEAENFMICRQTGGRVYKVILDEKQALTANEILRDEYAKMSIEEREAIFEEVLDYYFEEVKAKGDLILDPMIEVETLINSLKTCDNRQQISEIYKQLRNFEVTTPHMRHSPILEKADSEVLEEANKFSETFATIRAISNRHFLKIRLIEDEIFGATCWAALAKIFSFRFKISDHSQSVMILMWVNSLPFMPKQRRFIIDALKSQQGQFGRGAWGDEIRKAIDTSDVYAVAKTAMKAPVIYHSFPEVVHLGTEEEALGWLERNPPSTLPAAELREAIIEVVNRNFLLILEVLKSDPEVGLLAWGGILYLLEKNGESRKVDERISQEDGEEVFKHCVELHVKINRNPMRLISLMERRLGIPIEGSIRALGSDHSGVASSNFGRLIFESELKDYYGVSRYISHYLHSHPLIQTKSWVFAARRMMEEGQADLLKKIPIQLISRNDFVNLIRLPVAKSSKVFLTIFSEFPLKNPSIKDVISYYLYKISDSKSASESILENLASSIYFFTEAVCDQNEELLDRLARSADLVNKIEQCLNYGPNQVSNDKKALLDKFSKLTNKRISSFAKGVLLYLKIKNNEVDFDFTLQEEDEAILHESFLVAVRNNDMEGIKGLIAYRESLGLTSSGLIPYLSKAIHEKRLPSNNKRIARLIGFLYYKEDAAGRNTKWVFPLKSGKLRLSKSGIFEPVNRIFYLQALLAAAGDDKKLIVEKFLSSKARRLSFDEFLELITVAVASRSLSVLPFLGSIDDREACEIVKGGVLYCEIVDSLSTNHLAGINTIDSNSANALSSCNSETHELCLSMTATGQNSSHGSEIFDLPLVGRLEENKQIAGVASETPQVRNRTINDLSVSYSALRFAIKLDNAPAVIAILNRFDFDAADIANALFAELKDAKFEYIIREILKRSDRVKVFNNLFNLIVDRSAEPTIFDNILEMIPESIRNEIFNYELRSTIEEKMGNQNFSLLIIFLLNPLFQMDERLAELDQVPLSTGPREMFFEVFFKKLLSINCGEISEIAINKINKIINKIQISNKLVNQLIGSGREIQKEYVSALERKKK